MENLLNLKERLRSIQKYLIKRQIINVREIFEEKYALSFVRAKSKFFDDVGNVKADKSFGNKVKSKLMLNFLSFSFLLLFSKLCQLYQNKKKFKFGLIFQCME